MKKYIVSLLSLLSLSAMAKVTPKAAHELAKDGKAVLIDVREEDEVKEGVLQHAKWFPLSKINNDKNWKEDFLKIVQGKKIFLYCRSGNRSGKVADILKKEGIESENIGGYMTLKDEIPTGKL